MTILLAALAGLPAGWVGARAIEAWQDRAPLRGAPRAGRRPSLGVALATVGLFAAVAWRRPGEGLALVGLLALTWGLVVGTVIDLRRQRLPDRLTFKLAPLVAMPLLAESIRAGDWGDMGRAVVAGVLLPVGMLAFAEGYRLLRGRTGIGLGDVKLAPSLGLAMGWFGLWELLLFVYATIGASAVVLVGLLATRRVGLASRIPFGPYLALGALIILLAGQSATDLLLERVGW